MSLNLKTEDLSWEWKSYGRLHRDELYEVLKFRQEIFVVEQESWYLDADGLDQKSLHLLVRSKENLIGYLRLSPTGLKYIETSIGRVSIHLEHRGKGLGNQLLTMGIEKGKEVYGSGAFRISAQEHLISYYEKHGFKAQGSPYDEDGIPHIEMLLDE